MKIQSFVKSSKLKRARAKTTRHERMNVRVDGRVDGRGVRVNGRGVRVDGRVNGRAYGRPCTRTPVRSAKHVQK